MALNDGGLIPLAGKKCRFLRSMNRGRENQKICRGLHGAFRKKGDKNEDEDIDLFDSLALSLYIFFSYITYHDEPSKLHFNKTVIILSIV